MQTLEENIFDLLGNGSTSYHSAIITSYTFDLYFFTNYYMQQMRSRGIRNIVVLIDSTQYDTIMEDKESPGGFRNDFALLRVQNRTNGVFHPKVSLFIGERQALALVGSGNLTYSGMAHNKELWGAFCAKSKDTDEASIISDVWNYLSDIIVSSGSKIATQQLEWCRSCSDAIKDFESMGYREGYKPRFLFPRPGKTVFDQIMDMIDTDVRTIKIIAPYYDSEGSLINALKNRYNPDMIKCAIDESYGYVPAKMKYDNNIRFFHWHDVFCSENQFESAKKLHAKAIQFETSAGNYLLLGSSNATGAGFGLNRHCYNDEADIIIHSPEDDFFERLGINFNDDLKKAITDFHSGRKFPARTANESFPCHITLCEKYDGKLHISFDNDIPDIKIRVHFDEGYKDLDFSEDGIETDESWKIRYVAAVSDNMEISNKALVLDYADLAKRDPDSRLSKIESLFRSDNNNGWDNNIAKVLSYVNLDIDDMNRHASVHDSAIHSRDRTGTVIGKEQFDNTVFTKSPYTGPYSLNMHILDQIQFFVSNQQENYDEIDETSSRKDIVSGNAQDCSQERQINRTYSDRTEILGYLKRLKCHYDRLAKDFDNQDEFYRLQSKGVYFRNQITCNDYSYILIALMLIFHRLAYPVKGDENSIRYIRYCTELTGRFMMIYRAGYPVTNDYTYMKLEEMHRNFFVYSLLILSAGNMNKDTVGVWAMNLMETFKDDTAKLASCYNDYLRLSNEYRSLMNKHSAEAIEKARARYLDYLESIAAGGNIKTISKYQRNFYFHKEKFGFIFCKESYRATQEYYRLKVIYPGIKDETTFINNLPKIKKT